MSDEPDGVADQDPADAPLADSASAATSAGSSSVDPVVDAPSAERVTRARRAPAGKAREAADVEEVADTEALDDDLVESGPGDREAAVVGAAAGSARAAARRSVVRSGSTPLKGTATKARDTGRTESEGGIFARLRRFLREVVAELRKVIWPARSQMVTYTIVVIVFVVFMVALVAGLDVLFARGVLWIFG